MKEIIEYKPINEQMDSLEELKDVIKEDSKFAYSLHGCTLAIKMRNWGYEVLKNLPNKESETSFDWMKGYPCADFSGLIMNTILIHYPEIYDKLKKDIPVGYINQYIADNLYPLTIDKNEK